MIPEAEYTGREWALPLPAGTQLLNANQRFHWRHKAAIIADLRELAGWLAVQQRVPQLRQAHILLVLQLRDRRRLDPLNWADTAKALTDGLVDVQVVPDDSYRYVLGPDIRQEGPRNGQIAKRGGKPVRAVLHIRELRRMLWPRTCIAPFAARPCGGPSRRTPGSMTRSPGTSPPGH